jgi:hypothetical protein
MNDAEKVMLGRYVAAACPAQQWDEFTIDTWADIMPADFTFDECRSAVIVIKRRQPWIDPHDIITEVQRARRPAEDQQRLRTLLDPAANRAQIEATETAFLAKLAARGHRLREAPRALLPAPRPARSARPAPAGGPELDLSTEQATAVEGERARQIAALQSMRHPGRRYPAGGRGYPRGYRTGTEGP